ncbi:MAG TPA: dihydrofolate reductase family protein [Conexibacter sp.]|jgi:dihydrofolate reductase
MASLIYTAIASLDGYVADEDGKFDWSVPDAEVHQHVNDLERPVGTYLCGRRIYEVMEVWETIETGPAQPEVINDYATLWRAAEKVVYSRTLETVSTPRTRIERSFKPDAVRQLKASAAQDLSIAGPELAGQALAAGLVDEIRLFLSPVIVGGGKRALPDGVRLELSLAQERRFGNGVVLLRYRVG